MFNKTDKVLEEHTKLVAVLETTVTEVVEGNKGVPVEFSAIVSFIDKTIGAV